MKKILGILKYVLFFLAAAGAAAYILLAPVEEDVDLESSTFLQGIRINGIEVGGMTYGQAKERLKAWEEEERNKIYLDLSYQDEKYRLTDEELVTEYDTEHILKRALEFGRSGSPLERRRIRKETAQKGKEYRSTCYFGEVDQDKIEEICAEIEREPSDAAMTFSAEDGFIYRQEESGIRINRDELLRRIEEVCSNGKLTEIRIPWEEVPAEVTVEDLKKKTVLRTKYATSFAEEPYNDGNRVANIKKCVKLFNASKKTVLNPGEKLSLNDVLGDRTEAGGWKPAPGYVNGATEDQPGGGVCQMSTTLYGAALKADLKIVSRKNHSIPVGYAEKGLDATISTGGPDLVIENNTGSVVYLRAWISAEQKLYIEIYGKPFDGFDKIRLDTELIREIQPDGDMEVTVDESMTADEEKIVVKRRAGSEWKTYKVYEKNGKEIKRVLAAESVYKAYNGKKIIGTE